MYLQIAPRGRGNQAGTNRAREVRSSHASVGIVSTTRRTSCACRACSEPCPADAINYLYSPCALELIRAAEWVEHFGCPSLLSLKPTTAAISLRTWRRKRRSVRPLL